MANTFSVRFLFLALFLFLTFTNILLSTAEASNAGSGIVGVRPHDHRRRAAFQGVHHARLERRKMEDDPEETTVETLLQDDEDDISGNTDQDVEQTSNETSTSTETENITVGDPTPSPTKTKTRHSEETSSASAAASTTTRAEQGDDESDSKPNNPATIPTPITSTVNTAPVPLFVPPYDPQLHVDGLQVHYLGPGNAHSTVYQVLYLSLGGRPAVTATLIEDATAADLIGAQQATVLPDGRSTIVWEAVSCGFQDGLSPDKVDPAAGYCVYQNNVDRVTSTWTTAISTITAQTTITPSPGAVQSSIAAYMSKNGEAFVKPHNGNAKLDVPPLYLVLVSFALFYVL